MMLDEKDHKIRLWLQTVYMFDVTETIKYGPKIQTLVLHRLGEQVALY